MAISLRSMDKGDQTSVVIGRRIRDFRESHGLTQEALAKRLLIRQPSVSQWENGHTIPTLAMQRALADELSTRRSVLFRELVEAEDVAA